MKPMKQVVIIAPDFSPSSLPPALRIRFLATHLPSFGWEPTILSVDPGNYNWSIDPENEALVPPQLQVLRTGAFPAGITRKIGIGDIAMRSFWQQWRALQDLCRRRKPDLVFVSVPPFVTMLLGRMAYARFGIPYVIDYIDPWVITELYKRMPKSQRPPKWFAADLLSRLIEPLALRRVAHLTAVSRGTTDGIIPRYPWLAADQATEIPYGGEPLDFEYLRRNPRRQTIFRNDDGFLHISYVGRGGSDMNKALSAIFRCFRQGLDTAPELYGRVRFHFVGTTYAPDPTGQYQVLPLAEQFQIQPYVLEHPGRVPYLDAIQLLLDSDALLAIGSESRHYTASKIFPYIMAKKPLLAIYHEESSVVDILRKNDTGVVVAFSESKPEQQFLDEVGAGLRNLVSPKDGVRNAVPRDLSPEHTTRSMAARLASVFDQVIASTPTTRAFAGHDPVGKTITA